MDLSDDDKALVKELIDRGEPLPERFRWQLFAEPLEAELIWPGKTGDVTNVVLPFQSIEQIDEPRAETGAQVADLFQLGSGGRQSGGWSNKLIWGDNKLVLSSLKGGPLRREIDAAGGLKLVYIDPPFDVGADFSFEIEIGDDRLVKDQSVIEELAYRDTWGRGRDSFLSMMYPRLVAIHSLLAPGGSLYLHCDWRTRSHLKVMCDQIFGKEGFRNEIAWIKNSLGAKGRATQYPRNQDTILFFHEGRAIYLQSSNARATHAHGIEERRVGSATRI